jgi:PAS domain S-box-containing protein
LKKDIRILYLEDVPADVAVINHELRKGGFELRAKRVETREDFLYQLEHHPPDLIISDHGLPRFDGFAALALARERSPEVPFIFVTGSRGETVAIETFEKGATDYVLKSNLNNLVPAVNRALREAMERAALKEKGRALRESEERFRMLVEGVRDYAIFMLDSRGRVTSWNSGAQAIFGYHTNEVMGEHFSQFYTPQEVKRGRPALDLRVAVFAERFEEEGVRVGKNDCKFYAHVVITALRDTVGNLMGFAQVTQDITERVLAEEALRQSESLKGAILETALDAIISIDHWGRVQEWNPAAQKIFGYERNAAIGKPVDELIIPPATRNVYDDGLTNYLLTGAGSLVGKPIELTLRRKDGSEFPAELAINRLLTETPPRCTALVRDITDRQKAEGALRESEERYRMLVEGVKDHAIYMLDPAGHVATWNQGAERIEGYKSNEILGRPLADIFTPSDKSHGRLDQILKQAINAGRCPYEAWHVRKDGSRFWSEGTITALHGAAGHLIGFSKIGRDMSEQKKAEEGLRRLAAIIESSDDAIFSKTTEGLITSWNPGAMQLFGYTAQEIVGQPVLKLFPPDRVEEETRIMARVKRGETVPYFDTERRRKDGSLVPVSVTISPLKDMSGKVVGASQIARDITERKLAEEQIQQLNHELEERVRDRTAQLEASNRELEAFSYSVSHDLRAPLRHILGYVDILKSKAGTQLSDEGRQHLETIFQAATQMSQLIDALLNFSRMHRAEMHFVPVDLAKLVQAAQRELRHEVKDRKVVWEVGALPEVRGDPVMLQQVFVNLLSNAIKYSRPRAEARIEIGSRTEGGEVVCFVRDNGVGFAMDYVGKLFGVFQRLHRASEFEGIGIGLANVQRIIKRHGGRTWAEGVVEAGATFYFSLPLNLRVLS